MIKCDWRTLFGFAIIGAAALLSAWKGTLDWMSIAVLGGLLLPGARTWLKSMFKGRCDVPPFSKK